MSKSLLIVGLFGLVIGYQNCGNPIQFATGETLDNLEANLLEEDELANFPLLPPPEEPDDSYNPVPPITAPPIVRTPYDPPLTAPPMDRTPYDPPTGEESIGQCIANSFLVLGVDENQNEIYLGRVFPYENNNHDSIGNYNYKGFSANPIVGPEIKGEHAKIFLLKAKDGISLNIIFNQDNGGSPSNKIDWNLEVRGNSLNDKLIFKDDPNKNSSDSVVSKVDQDLLLTRYSMHLHYWFNTDGVIIGPLTEKSFEILVEPTHTVKAAENAAVFGPNSKVLLPHFKNNKNKLKAFKIRSGDWNCSL